MSTHNTREGIDENALFSFVIQKVRMEAGDKVELVRLMDKAIHQELQKAREEERGRIDKERPKGINRKTPIAFWAGMPEYPSSDYVKGFNECVSQTYYKIFNQSELD